MFQFTRLQDGRKVTSSTLQQAIGMPSQSESWLFVTPHDDDLVLGAGLWMQAAVAAGVRVEILIVTDGRMGYCTLEQRDRIVEIRKAEALESFDILGIDGKKITYLDYPDSGLFTLQGRRRAKGGDEVRPIEGYIGLQNALTYHLRRTRPARVFVPTSEDLHPDHQIVHNEIRICLFHACGAIWPELGEPLTEDPKLYELAVYCDFPEPPQLELHANDDAFETKLKGIAAYRSQLQIEQLVRNTREAGPYEYLREVDFRLYSASNHRKSFA